MLLWKMIVQEKSSLAHFTFDNNSQDWDYCQQRKCRKFNKAPTLRIISKECLTTKKGNFIEQDLNSVKEVWVWSLKMSCPSPYLNQGLFSQLLQSRQTQWMEHQRKDLWSKHISNPFLITKPYTIQILKPCIYMDK